MSREDSPVPFPGQVTLFIATADGRAYAYVKVDRDALEDEELVPVFIKQTLERLDERLAELVRGGRTPDQPKMMPLWTS